MQAYKFFLVGVVGLFLVGCATQEYPQNADEFRKLISSSSWRGTTEEVNSSRSFSDIIATFKKMAPQCMNVQVRTESKIGMAHSITVEQYRATVTANTKKLELDMQMEMVEGKAPPGKSPSGGRYIMVIDVTPVGNGKSKAIFYRPSIGYSSMIKSIKGWVTGESAVCPDLTSVM